MNERRSDFELLQAFLRYGEQPAFAQVLRRHLDLVYATAVRKVGDAGAAQEVAQNVFAALVRKAWQFGPEDSLPAWLYKTTLLESKDWLRGELRRRRREQTAAELGTTMKTPDHQPALRVLVPLLDEALLSLREKERTALLLRFYENQSLREVGASLGVGEDAAQKRVANALAKLTAFFQRRGFRTATVAASAAALQHTAASAPVAVANSVLLAIGQLTPPAMMGLAALGARLASWTKLQTGAICLALAVAPIAWQWQEQRRARAQVLSAQTELRSKEMELFTARTEIERLSEAASRLTALQPIAADSTEKMAEQMRKFEAWKTRLRGLLTADDYRWPEDSPFVRIPKSALRQLEVRHAMLPPGVLKPETRELLGLTAQERERIEGALHEHFATIDNLIEDRIYETNKVSHFGPPSSAIASKMWFMPALGDEIKTRGDQLESVLKETLGNERWPLVKEQLQSSGTDTLRRILNLDAGESAQEFGVWIFPWKDKLTVGYGWSGHYSSFTSDGVSLDSFQPDAAVASGRMSADFFGARGLPDTVTRRFGQWIQQEAVRRLGKEK